jgi:hypothetical protein
MAYKKDKLILYALAFNIFILIVMCIFAINHTEENELWITFKTIWFLSFGWICGRISTY